jgi:hypothetical protein
MPVSSHYLDSLPNRYPLAPGPSSERVLCPTNLREPKCGNWDPATVALCDPSAVAHVKKTGRTPGATFPSSSKTRPRVSQRGVSSKPRLRHALVASSWQKNSCL